MSFTKTVAPLKTLESYIEDYNQLIRMVDEHYSMCERIQQQGEKIGRYIVPLSLYDRKDAGRVKKEILQSTWKQAFDVTGFRSFMDETAREEFEDSLVKNPPEFTVDNVRSVFLDVGQQADMLMRRGLVTLFQGLSGNYRSHDPFRVKKKLIVTYMVSVWSGISIRFEQAGKINDLDRVVCWLQDRTHIPRSLESAINTAWKDSRDYEDDNFTVRGFKNSNAHIIFKDQALVDQINDVIAEWYSDGAIPNAA